MVLLLKYRLSAIFFLDTLPRLPLQHFRHWVQALCSRGMKRVSHLCTSLKSTEVSVLIMGNLQYCTSCSNVGKQALSAKFFLIFLDIDDNSVITSVFLIHSASPPRHHHVTTSTTCTPPLVTAPPFHHLLPATVNDLHSLPPSCSQQPGHPLVSERGRFSCGHL